MKGYIHEIIETRPQITYEEKKEIKEYKSDANSVRGLILGLINKFLRDAKKGISYNPRELEVIFSEALRRFNELYPQKITKIVIIEGWENKNGEFPIGRNVDGDFVVEIWRDEKMQKTIVEKDNINRMLKVVRQLEKGKDYDCYKIAELLGIEWKTIWKERMRLYFKIYYFPLKILNELKVVKYGENKRLIRRLK